MDSAPGHPMLGEETSHRLRSAFPVFLADIVVLAVYIAPIALVLAFLRIDPEQLAAFFAPSAR
jgi:hypothetical protein